MAGAGNQNAVSAGPTPAPVPPMQAGGGNIYNQSAYAYKNAIAKAGSAGGYTPIQEVSARDVGTKFGYDPASAAAQTAVGGISQYMNPYTQQVIDTSMADLERQRLIQENQIGAQAAQARAFGGSRHGVADALTNEAFARQGGQLASGLRHQGFTTALGAAQTDASNALQASIANMMAKNQSNEFAQRMQFESERANQQSRLQAALANQQAHLTSSISAADRGLAAAGQLGNLANLGFNMGQQITQQQMQQGSLQQALQQQLIDAAKAQYQGYIGAPQQSLGLPLQALGTAPVPQTTTQSRQPGLFDYLTMGATAASGTNFAGKSDPRLKTNVQPKGEFKGVKFYTWDWNETAKGIVNPKQPTFGVMADELQKTHPHLVEMGEDGYLQVNYAQLSKELAEAA